MVVCVKMMLKQSKEALTVLIVTHVKRVESGVCGLCTQYRYIQCYVKGSKGSKDYIMLKQGTNTFLLITFLILNRFSIRKKF